jgi:recombination protein RecA
MLQTIGMAQKEGMKCAYIDAERRFRANWAEKLGVDTESLDISRVRSIPDFADAGMDLIRAGYDLIVVDSTSALLPEMFFDEHGEVKSFDDTKQLGRFAADMGKACRMHLAEATDTAIVHISQIRKEVGQQKAPDIPTGGKEIRHRDSLRIKLTSSASDSYAIKEAVAYGDNLIEEAVGRPVTWLINKNGLTGTYTSGNYDFYVKGDHNPGVDYRSELIEFAKKYGIVVVKGSWYNLYGEQMQGAAKLNKYLVENPTVQEKLEAELYDKSL